MVVFPAPFTPTTMITAGGCADLRQRALGGFQDFEQMLADQRFDFGGIAQQMTLHALADALQNLGRGADADVGGDERVLELFEDIGVDFLAPADGVFQLLHQPGAGFLDAGLETVEEDSRRRATGNLPEECRKESGLP